MLATKSGWIPLKLTNTIFIWVYKHCWLLCEWNEIGRIYIRFSDFQVVWNALRWLNFENRILQFAVWMSIFMYLWMLFCVCWPILKSWKRLMFECVHACVRTCIHIYSFFLSLFPLQFHFNVYEVHMKKKITETMRPQLCISLSIF